MSEPKSIIYEYQKEYIKKYQEKNKELIDNRNKEIIKCELCNIEICRYSMYSHKKTKKHLKNLLVQ